MKKTFRGIGLLLTLALSLGTPGAASVSHAADVATSASVSDGNLYAPEWESGEEELLRLLAEQPVMAVVYMQDYYQVKEGPESGNTTVATLASGQTVYVKNVVTNAAGEVWVYVRFQQGGGEYSGYIRRQNLAVSDERFLEWESNYLQAGTGGIPVLGSIDNRLAEINQFPESYRPALQALKANHPNWIFVPMNTGLNWDTVITEEMKKDRSLIHKSMPDYMKQGLYGGSWYYATEGALRYYMDPRNGLTENAIFQFEQLTYNETYHTENAVAAFLNNTFMKGPNFAPGTEKTYAHIIWSVGQDPARRVSPFHLAARIYQEQGAGTSPLISGTYPGYEGYYNYFNVNASGQTNEQVIKSGLEYAKKAGWSDAEKSIAGGSDVISKSYIQKGQDTLYLQKYNVNPQGGFALYDHQYMQNIMAPTTEAASIRKLYAQANSLDNTFVFKIPVYNGMPQDASPMPVASTAILLNIPEGYDKIVYLDGVAYPTVEQNGGYVVTASDQNKKSAVSYKYDASGVAVGMYVWTLRYEGGKYIATPQPEMQDLLTYHGFSIRISGKPGIRVKTGISAELRAKLLGSGVDGYRLKEYGTLAMRNTNRSTYPMIKGGEKVAGALSYGVDESGQPVDKVFETVSGRYRFTSVLVGQPVSEYKTDYAFRGYIVLEKNGQQTIIYGPPVARNIYQLAKQLVENGVYKPNSDEYNFLQQLITDADNYSN